MKYKSKNNIIVRCMMFCVMLLICSVITSLPVLAAQSAHVIKGLEAKVSGDYRYQYCESCNGIAIIEYTGKDKVLYVPKEIDGIQVKEIASYAFGSNNTLEEVVLPEGLVSMGSSSFYFCQNLKKINIPEGIKELSGVFWHCKSLTSVSLPQSLVEINAGAFKGCEALETIEIPKGVRMIGASTFRDCRNLKKIELSESIKLIGNRAFQGCTNLKSIKIPDSVLHIDRRAFYGCSGLRKVTLPKQVYALNRELFLDCTNLREVTLPASLQYIERNAFKNCKNLKKIVFKGSKVQSVKENVFKGIHKNAVFDVPKKAIKKYKKLFTKESGFIKKTMKIK